MSSIPCKSKDKDDEKNCFGSHESTARRAGVNPTLCEYGEDCRTKNSTFTHLTSPKGLATTTKANCNYDVNCTRPGCHFNHPNGRLIDQKAVSSSDSTQQNTAPNHAVLSSSRLEYHEHQRRDSSQSDTSSSSHFRSLSKHSRPAKGATATTKANCNYDVNCTRSGCHFNHPNGRLIDQKAVSLSDNTQPNTASRRAIPSLLHSENRAHHIQYSSKTSDIVDQVLTNIHTKTTKTTIHEKSQRPSGSELIEMISKLLAKANEQQTEFDSNDQECKDSDDDQECKDSDDEQVLDDLRKNVSQELRLQRNEFQSTIDTLSNDYMDIRSSAIDTEYNVVQLECIQNKIERELKRWQLRLPIYARRSDIMEKLERNQVFILKADTGSGKSTQTVQYLCDANFADEKQIICTQPRKLAARSLAARVAEEYGCQIGEEVGFHVGGGRPTTSKRTKIKFVTDTLFLNEYKNDPMLLKYSVVLVDEAHERKIDTDIVLGLMKQCLKKRKDLKLVVMSATLDMDLLYNYFANDFKCDTLEVGGRTYPIEDFYLDDDVENYIQASVTKAVEIHQSDEIGDILVFLTGQDEIDLALADLCKKLENDKSYIGLPLHGKLSEEENAQIFESMPDKRKIIFSTNVAETSVTIDGIKHVVESGMVKEKMWDEKRKMQMLKIGQITKSSVKQRRGRAGRTSAGKVRK
ncbi:unnamed protein product [Rotaria sp. Silwood2]|nr:unnamed protein product [Rotaria sp. Silwood2]